MHRVHSKALPTMFSEDNRAHIVVLLSWLPRAVPERPLSAVTDAGKTVDCVTANLSTRRGLVTRCRESHYSPSYALMPL